MALPRLNNPSDEPNLYGTMAPVRMIDLPFTCAARYRAVSSMVSVPWVMTIANSFARLQATAIFLRSMSVISRLSFIIKVSTRVLTRDLPMVNISSTCVFLKNSSPFSSLYSLSNVPPVMSKAIFMKSVPRGGKLFCRKHTFDGWAVCHSLEK